MSFYNDSQRQVLQKAGYSVKVLPGATDDL
jgi:hypothetical protein